jgi:signal peptidase I
MRDKVERKKKEKRPALILRLVWAWGWHPGRVSSEILEWIEVLVVAGALAFLVITFITVRMHVPTGSMEPTIHGDPNGLKADSFFVDKISYYFRSPKPGDIVVFWHTEAVAVGRVLNASAAARAKLEPKDQILYVNSQQVFSAADANAAIAALADGTEIRLGTSRVGLADLGAKRAGVTSLRDLGIVPHDQRTRYVKRLIAVAGQSVYVKDGGVYVDGQKLEGARFQRTYTSNDPRMRFGIDPAHPTVVPEGTWFVLGDNSADSWDSRFWGFVDRKDFIGEPYLRVWPLTRFGPMNGYFHF